MNCFGEKYKELVDCERCFCRKSCKKIWLEHKRKKKRKQVYEKRISDYIKLVAKLKKENWKLKNQINKKK